MRATLYMEYHLKDQEAILTKCTASSFGDSKRHRDILFLLSADACRSIQRSLKLTKTFKLLSRVIEHVLNIFVRLQLIHSLR